MRARMILGLALGLWSSSSSVHAAPPEGPSEPGALPSYDAAPIAAPPAFPSKFKPTPVTGVGRIVTGSFLLAGGGVMIGTMVDLWASPPSYDGGCDPTVDTEGDCRNGIYDGLAVLIEIPIFIAGMGAVVSGGVLLGTGIADHRKYRAWKRKQSDGPVPPPGDGMLVSGVTLMITGIPTGIATLTLTGAHLGDPGAAAAFTTSVVATLGGVGLVIGSTFLRKKHMRWQNARMAPTLSPLPGARPGLGGLSFGIAGRF